MINKYYANKFCKDDITKIENYEKAIADDNIWDCHHRLETHKYKDRSRKEWIKRDENVSRKELIVFDVYYNRPAEELVFLSHAEHTSLHMKSRKLSEKTKQKMSEAAKGHKKWLGKHHSEETKRKMSETQKGRQFSAETRHKMSEAAKARCAKGRHWKLNENGKRVYY